jgi:Carboxypeptidase regulatory-like domain
MPCHRTGNAYIGRATMSQSRSYRLLLLLVLLLASLAIAQTSLSGAIGGAAWDAQHAAVVHAQITVQSAETGERLEALTGADGAYRIVGLKPGIYSLTAASQGFTEIRLLRVTVEVGRITEVQIAFAVAAAPESVEVRDETPAVNTSQPDFATNVDDAAIDNLPINGRRWSNFALLTPGATLDGDFGLISFRGISGLLNNSTVDGADNNQAFFSEERGRTRISYVISQAAVREFQVNTSNFSAEYGRAAGAVVNAVTRSGGNRLHGSAFYYMRDNSLGATNAFTVVPAQKKGVWSTQKIKPPDRRQQFGATLGGPIVKDKLFFFTTFDAQRRDFPAVAAANKPSSLLAPPCVSSSHYAGMSAANQAQVRICSSRDELYTLTRNVMPLYTSDATAIAAFQAGTRYLASLLGPVHRTADHQIGLAKLDYHLNSRNTLSLMYNRTRSSSPGGVQSEPVVARGIASFGFDGVKVDTLTARLTSTLGHSLANELRYSWSRDFEYQVAQPPAPGEPVGPNGLAPSVAVLAYSSGFTSGTPTTMPRRALPNESRNQIAETMSWMHGRHVSKFGFDANRVQDVMNNLYAVAGSYNYNDRDNFIADLCQWQGSPIASFCPGQNGFPTQYRGYSSFIQGFGNPGFAFHTFDGALFAQDDWRLLRRLTLNFGLRYEFELLPSPQMPNPLLPGSQSFSSDMNNFGPRVGFAWALTSDGRTALRGGYGVYYGRIGNSTISSAITNTGTQSAQRSYSYSYKACYLFAKNCLEGPLYPNVNSGAPADPYSATQGGNVAVFAPNMQTPQIHQADLILERQIAPNTIVSASYLLSLGRDLPNFVDINLDPGSRQDVTYSFTADRGVPGPYFGHTLTVPVYTARLNPNFQTITQIRSNVNSSYSALVLQFNRTSSKGLGFKLNYTWSHALDDGQSSTTFTTHNNTLSPIPFTYKFDGVPHLVSRPDYGTSNYDIRQRLTASLFWSPRLFRQSHGLLHDALDHWTLAPVVHFATGKPFSDHISGNAPIDTCAGCLGFMGTGGQDRLPLLGRNSFRHGNLFNTDLRLSRRISLGENRPSLELLAEAFNLFNHQLVTSRTSTLYTVKNRLLEYDSNFSTPTAAANTIYRERQIQLGLRLHF